MIRLSRFLNPFAPRWRVLPSPMRYRMLQAELRRIDADMVAAIPINWRPN